MYRFNVHRKQISASKACIVSLVFFLFLLFTEYSFSKQELNVISNIDYIQDSNNKTFIIYSSTRANYKVGKVPASKDEPYRVYLDFEDTELGKNIPYVSEINDSVVKRIRSVQFDVNTARVVFDLSNSKTKPMIMAQNAPNRVEVFFGEKNSQGNKSNNLAAKNDNDTYLNKNSDSTDNTKTHEENHEINIDSNGKN